MLDGNRCELRECCWIWGIWWLFGVCGLWTYWKPLWMVFEAVIHGCVFCIFPKTTAGILYSLHNEYLILNVGHLLRMVCLRESGLWTIFDIHHRCQRKWYYPKNKQSDRHAAAEMVYLPQLDTLNRVNISIVWAYLQWSKIQGLPQACFFSDSRFV